MFKFVIWKNFSVRVVKHWNKPLRDVTWSVVQEVFRQHSWIDAIICTRWSQELDLIIVSPFQPEHLMILYVDGETTFSIFQWGFTCRCCAQLERNYLQPENNHMSKSASAAFIYKHPGCICCGSLPCLFILLYSVSSVLV